MIIPDRAASVNPFSQTFSKTLRISMIIAKEGHMPFTLSPQQRVSGSADTAARRWRRKTPYLRAREMAPVGGRGLPGYRRAQKGARHRKVSFPLLTPLTFLCADTSEMCGETGVTGARFRAFFSLYVAVMP